MKFRAQQFQSGQLKFLTDADASQFLPNFDSFVNEELQPVF